MAWGPSNTPIIGDALSGGIKSNAALVRVQAPNNSTITATKGSYSKRLYGHRNSLDSSEYEYYLLVNNSQFDDTNPWRITTVSGNKSTYNDVIVDHAYEYEVIPMFEYVIFSSDHTSEVGNFSSKKSDTDYSFSLLNSNTAWGKAQICNKTIGQILYYKTYDLTPFHTLSMNYQNVRISNYGGGQFGMYIMSTSSTPTLPTTKGSSVPSSYEPYWGAPTVYEATDRICGSDYTSNIFSGTFTIDVSSFTGNHRIGVGIGRSSVGAGDRYLGCEITNWWLH